MKRPLRLAFVVAFGIALSCVGSAAPRTETDAKEWRWVWVAGFVNPSLSPAAERAITLIGDALDAEGVRWSAAGSAGFSLCVDSRDLPRGGEIVREVVARHDLPVGFGDDPLGR